LTHKTDRFSISHILLRLYYSSSNSGSW